MADKEFSLWGQNPAAPQEAPVEETRTLMEWAGWPRKKLPKTVEIEETTLEKAMVDRHVEAVKPAEAPAEEAGKGAAPAAPDPDVPATSPAL